MSEAKDGGGGDPKFMTQDFKNSVPVKNYFTKSNEKQPQLTSSAERTPIQRPSAGSGTSYGKKLFFPSSSPSHNNAISQLYANYDVRTDSVFTDDRLEYEWS
jgi:hypothetical protein